VAGGAIDGSDDNQISGWAWDPKEPDRPVKVAIHDGPTLLDTVVADQLRQDLLDAKVGNGRHGFSYALPPRLKDGRAHEVRLTVAGTTRELDGSPKTIQIGGPQDKPRPDPGGPAQASGFLDSATAEGISGWAWDPTRPDTPIHVDIIFDGDNKNVVTVAADQPRGDLAKDGLGNGKHGFGCPTPARLRDGKSHTVRAIVTGTKIELNGSPKTAVFKSP
jgi:hypothetical protein